MATYRAKHPHIFPCFQLFPKFCAVEVDGLRYPFCTFRFGAIDQHRENVFIIFHVSDSTPVQRDLQTEADYNGSHSSNLYVQTDRKRFSLTYSLSLGSSASF